MLKSFVHAFRGIFISFLGRNLKIQIIIAVAVVLSGMYFSISRAEWIAVFFCICLVLSLEIMNSAIEKAGDSITTHINPIIRDMKDLAAGSVLIASIFSAIIGMIIFYPYLIVLI